MSLQCICFFLLTQINEVFMYINIDKYKEQVVRADRDTFRKYTSWPAPGTGLNGELEDGCQGQGSCRGRRETDGCS